MIWATEKPTKPGWYWWKIKAFHCEDVIRITNYSNQLSFQYGPVSKMSGEWSGPIP